MQHDDIHPGRVSLTKWRCDGGQQIDAIQRLAVSRPQLFAETREVNQRGQWQEMDELLVRV